MHQEGAHFVDKIIHLLDSFDLIKIENFLPAFVYGRFCICVLWGVRVGQIWCGIVLLLCRGWTFVGCIGDELAAGCRLRCVVLALCDSLLSKWWAERWLFLIKVIVVLDWIDKVRELSLLFLFLVSLLLSLFLSRIAWILQDASRLLLLIFSLLLVCLVCRRARFLAFPLRLVRFLSSLGRRSRCLLLIEEASHVADTLCSALKQLLAR